MVEFWLSKYVFEPMAAKRAADRAANDSQIYSTPLILTRVYPEGGVALSPRICDHTWDGIFTEYRDEIFFSVFYKVQKCSNSISSKKKKAVLQPFYGMFFFFLCHSL